MQLIEYLDLFIGSIINVMFGIIIVKKVFKVNVKEKKLEVVLYILLTAVLMAIINFYNKDIFKIVLTLPVLALGIKFIFNIDFSKGFLYTVVITIYMFLGEIIASILLTLSTINYNFIVTSILGKSIGAIIVCIITFPLTYIKILHNFFDYLLIKMNSKSALFKCIIIILLIGAFTYKNIRGINSIISILVNFIIYGFFGFIIFLLYKESKKSEQLSNEYNVLLSYLDKYEIELDEKRKIVHDFKNELIVINGYADDSNIKLKEYISEIVNDHKKSSSSSLIKGVDKLPRGIKGLVYYKLSQLDRTYIVEINIKDSLEEFNDIDSKTNRNILKMIGILIDNAIEAVSSLDEKYINLKFSFVKNEIIIEIINNCYEKLDQEKIMASGYSTKGENRGYGLSLVDEIIKSNDKIKFEINNDSNLFKVILKINIK